MQTMGNEARKTHCSHKELQGKQRLIKKERHIVHTRSYNCKQWVMKQGRLMFTQGVTMQTMGNEASKTHSSHNELQCKQWVMKEDSLYTQ
ncbi:hypothetical protein KSS87_001050 [Heliosperma pusillum]|nr:hypothetical protein KSS87_001050 [Heliosperma pusillum]